MHIEIIYSDGTQEQVAVDIEGEWVMAGRSMIPGHVVSRPTRCYFQEDYFQAALDESGDRAGSVEALEGDDFESFTWILVGSEADLCRRKMRQWAVRLGNDFDPLAEMPHDLRADEDQANWRRDQQCWVRWLEDPALELRALVVRPNIPTL